jgi:hypothetical protein
MSSQTSIANFEMVERHISEIREDRAEVIVLNAHGIDRLPSLADLPFVRSAKILFAGPIDIGRIGDLANLASLELEFSNPKDFAPIAKLQRLEALVISNCVISDISPLRNLVRLEKLDLSYTSVSDLAPLTRLTNLRSLNLQGSKVSNLSPVANLKKLESLNVSRTAVRNLLPLANLTSLLKGARQVGHQYDKNTYGGILFSNCPIEDSVIRKISSHRKKDRTEGVIRRLQELVMSGAQAQRNQDEFLEPAELDSLTSVPTPFEFELASSGKIGAIGSSANWPALPFEASKVDLARRLDASREVANDIIIELEGQSYQVRREYLRELKKYVSRLPVEQGSGNILLADAAARILRSLFATEADVLSVAFASSLKTFLEQHMGLRVYYPEIQTFYADVREGRISSQLPLDAIGSVAKAINRFTPDVFQPNVSESLSETSTTLEATPELGVEHAQSGGQVLVPPPDPLGEIDPGHARDVSVAGMIGKIWKVFLIGEKLNQAVSAWISAGHALKPLVEPILLWLKAYLYGAGAD